MSIARGLIYAATGALQGFERKKQNELEEEERERTQRLRELQEMTYLTSLLNTPGVMATGDRRAGMPQLGPQPKGMSDIPIAGGVLSAGWDAARSAGQAAGPERDIIPLGQAGGQTIGFDPYMSSSAQAERAGRSKEYAGLLEEAQAEIANYEAYEELKRQGVRVGTYSDAVDYPAVLKKNLESGITEGASRRGRVQSDALIRARTAERDAASDREADIKRDVRNRAFTMFLDNDTATVGDFQKTMSPEELEVVDLPSLQSIWKDTRNVDKDPGPAELRAGLSKSLGKPGARTWSPDGGDPAVLDPSWHQTVLDLLTEPYKGLGRPLTTEEVLDNFRGAYEAGELTEFELKTIEEVLRPLQEQGNRIVLADGSVIELP